MLRHTAVEGGTLHIADARDVPAPDILVEPRIRKNLLQAKQQKPFPRGGISKEFKKFQLKLIKLKLKLNVIKSIQFNSIQFN